MSLTGSSQRHAASRKEFDDRVSAHYVFAELLLEFSLPELLSMKAHRTTSNYRGDEVPLPSKFLRFALGTHATTSPMSHKQW